MVVLSITLHPLTGTLTRSFAICVDRRENGWFFDLIFVVENSAIMVGLYNL